MYTLEPEILSTFDMMHTHGFISIMFFMLGTFFVALILMVWIYRSIIRER